MNFEAWMQEVDKQCNASLGLSIRDLADAPFRDWFDDGLTPQGAWQAYRDEGRDDLLEMFL